MLLARIFKCLRTFFFMPSYTFVYINAYCSSILYDLLKNIVLHFEYDVCRYVYIYIYIHTFRNTHLCTYIITLYITHCPAPAKQRSLIFIFSYYHLKLFLPKKNSAFQSRLVHKIMYIHMFLQVVGL